MNDARELVMMPAGNIQFAKVRAPRSVAEAMAD